MSPDLRSRDAWASCPHPKTGEKLPDVIESTCRRFTVCKTTANRREVFMAWRRRPKPEMADLVGTYATPEQARDACQRYAEAKG